MRNRAVPTVAAALFVLLLCPAALLSRENSSELYRKGARLAASGKLDLAIPVFKRVIELSPYYCMGHYGLGKAYLYRKGMLDEAITQLRASVRLDRKFAKGYFYLGMACLFSNKYVPATAAFNKAYRYDPSYVEALYNLGVIYDITGRRYESQVYFTRYFDEKSKKEEDVLF
jgi:tetratricopeptide (TPR) repeat protein